MYLADGITYDYVLKDSIGTVIWTRDVVQGGAPSFVQSGTGATPRPLLTKQRDVMDARDFGVVADGTTDDTAAWQLAINAA